MLLWCNLGHWQMGTLGLESVLVGDVVHGVDLSVSAGEGVRSTDNQSLNIIGQLLQLSLFLAGLSIAGLEAVSENGKKWLVRC